MTAADLLMDSQDLIEKFPLIFRLNRLRLVAPKVDVHIESGSFIVETVSNPSDLKEIFKLRYEVFFREFAGRGDRFTLMPYDVDLHDFVCDHLVVRNKSDNRIVATYRLLFQGEGEERTFYTEGEFDLSEFRKIPGNKLELGRACVHRDFRNGAVISLLWKGLCQYAKKTSTRYMFGCSSVCRPEFGNLPYIQAQLAKKNWFVTDYQVKVRKEYSLNAYPQLTLPTEMKEGSSMPSLMNMYLLAGAKMGQEMAYDEEMDCLDLFTVLDFTCLPPSFERRFA